MKTKINHLTSKGAVFAASFLTLLAVSVFAVAPAQGAPQVSVSAASKDGDVELNSKTDQVPGKPGEVVPVEVTPPSPNLITATTYPFSTALGGILEDMSTGTTTLVAASSDDGNSVISNIGFEFWYDGVRFTQFGANANGFIRLGVIVSGSSFDNTVFDSTTNAPKIAPFWDDLCTGTTGKVHFKTVGTAPNRKLVIEWQNMQITRGAGCAGVGGGTFQMHLFESAGTSLQGAIQFYYGPGMVATAAADGGYSVGLQSGVATNFASVTTATNTVSYAASNETQTDAIAAGRAYFFTPNVPAAPGSLNFTSITPTSMQINWSDNSANEFGFVLYRSTDGTNFSFLTQTAANAVSFVDTGLSPSTTYFYRVHAVSEGALSAALAGSQMTAAPGNITSAASGNWSAGATWVGGVPPTAGDNVTIATGHTVTIDSSNALSVTIQSGGILEYEATTARTLTVGSFVTINAGGAFRTAASGTQTGHILSVGTNLTNNGTLDFSTNADTAGANITFTGAASNTFSGAGAINDVRTITVNKGVSSANIIELTTSNFTVLGVNTDVAGYLTLTNGTWKISGTFTMANRTFTTPTYNIPATGGIWLNNPNYTVSPTASGTTTNNNGLFRLTAGTYNIGLTGADGMGGGTNSTFIVEGGTINAVRIDPQSAGASWTQSAGTVNVNTPAANTRSNFGSFEFFSATSFFTMSGGTINLVNPMVAATKVDYRVLAAFANQNVTGGTLVAGGPGAPAASTYNVSGVAPSTTVNAGHTMAVNGAAFFMRGSTLLNNGAITSIGASPRLDFGSQNSAMTYSGAGTFGTLAAPFGGVGISANSTFLTTLNSPIVTVRVNLFQGGFVNSGQITLGNGGASTTVVQIGSTGLTTPGGNFDVSPVHNQGTGGEIVLYAFETAARTTGFEINPTRTLFSIALIDNPNHVTIAGGDLTLSTAAGALTLTQGRLITGANTLILSSGTATVARTTGYVDGNFRKTYAAAANKTFEVGTANSYSPVAVNVTAGTFPATFTAKAVQGPQPNIPFPQFALQRYWTLTEGGDVTGDLTFTYATDAIDVPGTATEANFVIQKVTAGVISQPGGTVNTAANTANIVGVTDFSDWTLAEPQGVATPTPSPTPTATPTPTPTPTVTPTPPPPTVTPTATPTATASPSASASASPTCAPTVVSYTGAPVAIPDNNTTGVNLVVAVAGLSSIQDLDLRFDGTISSPDPLSTTVGVNHSWVGDMIFRLTSPGGTTVTLYDRPGVPASTFGCSSNNLFALTLDDEAGSALEGQCPGGTDAGPLTGTFTPNSPLSAFDGEDPNGNWTLTAIDAAGGDTGTVRNFSLIFGGACGTPPPSPTASPTSSASPSASASASPTCPPVITHSSSQAITALNSVSCNNGVGHTDNSYWRAFNMGTFAGGQQYNVTSVSFGVEEATGAGGTQPVTVRLYTTTNFPVGFPGSLTQIATTTIQVPDTASGTVLSVPLVATVPAGTAELVMELFTPDGQAAGNLFFVGSNAAAETGPSYLSAAACGITTPTTTSAIGFPNMHIVFNVLGGCGPGGTPSPTATASAGTPTPSPTCTPSGFVAVAPMPIDLYGGTAASDGTFVYVAGGYSFSASATLDVFNRYDPVANTWTPMPAMAAPAANMASAVYSPINNKIYVFGGGDAVSGVVSNVTRIYDIGTNSWTTGAAMPAVRGFMASGYHNGKIYLVAGYSTGNVTPTESQVWEYDPVANTWDTTRLAIPHPIGGAGFGIINGHIYVAGGRDGVDVAYNGLWDYDIAANTWTQRANLLAGDNVPGSAVINGQLWIFGGGNPFLEVPTTTGQTQIYDPGSDSWSMGPPLTAARSFVVGTTVGNTVFAAGGYNGSTTVASAETTGPCSPGGTPTPSPSATCVPGGGTTVSYTGAPVAIPDNNTTGVTAIVAVSGVGTISDLNIRFDGTVSSPDPLSTTVGVNHSWVGDMIFRLTSPGGTTVTFYDRPGVPASTFGCSSNNLFALTLDDEAGSALEGQCPGDTDAGPLTGTFTPNNPLSAFDGQNADGNWTLTAIDAAGGDIGTLRNFSLIFGGGGCASPTPSGTPATPTPTPTASCPPVITHSTSQAITPLNSVSCNNGVGHTDNSYWRAFNMGTFAGGAQYNVTSVSFGVEEATGAGGTQPVTVRLYTTTNFPVGFPGSLTQIATTTVQVPDAASGTVLSVPLVATVPAGTSELVMELFTPDGQAAGNLFFVGSNAAAETGPSYLSAAGCGITTPSTTASIGFPDMHIVFNVLGGCTPATPTPSPTVTPGTPTPTPTATPASPTPTITPPDGTPTPTPTASPSASPVSKAINLSTRMRVQTGDRVGIGGFIIAGNSPKSVIIRAIGPTLAQSDIVDFLADPVLELHSSGGGDGATGFPIINNNWRDTQEAEIQATGIPPTNDLESAIVATLDPGAYTAIVKGNGNTSGVALVEVYDLNVGADAKLANLSTRAFVSTGDNIVIAGFLLSDNTGINGLGGPNDDRVIVRGIGPSLAPAPFPASAVLADPTLELRDANGSLIISNNDWQDNAAQAAEITAAGLAPGNSLESAIAATLPPGLYTALLAGRNAGTGIGVVEIYDRGPETPAP